MQNTYYPDPNTYYPEPGPYGRPFPKPPRAKKPSFLFIIITMFLGSLALCAVVALCIGIFLAQENSTPRKAKTQKVTPLHPKEYYNLTIKPSITADFIDSVLDNYASPAKGKGQKLYDYGLKYGIDPAYALAFFLEESNFGTAGVATVTHSLGNIRAADGQPEYKGYRRYATWEEGFEDWYRLISKQYVQKWGLHTVDQIVPIYAPSEDNNNVDAYIRVVKQAIDTWRQGDIEV
ncbi:hypothetical protein EPA93_21635 [Ktedonosporobacter rubrisoli]|uniref:Mannosyl-glycoprotein endo-beta-N-acetylglucosamidase-like domain-containing protein n=1 Tax=Ktedonosporobacter rubrisoli TaxID=2509675 RepID=A0A4P6JSR6_KTERU|nr:glucosaminidase domain-containing protein [Ktedonosporobacter rubrisoli]QBD78454.1 hypothetical protein EPA93_21635 [Ktedonosporobacter rubrisoli]